MIIYPNHDHLNITTMMMREDILAELMADPMTKVIEETGQGDIITLKQELAEKVAKIKTTDVAEKRRKFVFLVVVLGYQKYDMVIGNLAV